MENQELIEAWKLFNLFDKKSSKIYSLQLFRDYSGYIFDLMNTMVFEFDSLNQLIIYLKNELKNKTH